MIDVLLVSPRLPPTDHRRCGDHAYTDTLLQNPPTGIRYHHYEDLLTSDRMRRIRLLQASSYYLTKWGVLPPDMWFESLATTYMPDLVHIIAFTATVRFSKRATVPVIVHAASPSITDLTVKQNWSRKRVNRFYRRKRLFLRLTRAHHYALNADRAAKVLVQTEYGRNLILDYGDVPADKVEVLYPAQPIHNTIDLVRNRGNDEITFLFVGSDFERKNGPMVVEAFQRVRETYPLSRLVLVGRPANGKLIDMEGITHRMFVPHQDLLEHVFPGADVFILPTRAEGSFAFTLFEALSMGLPAITVNAWAMPEIIKDGENGFLIRSDSLDDLIDCMKRLASQPDLVTSMRRRSKQIFQDQFSIKVHNRQLRSIYDQVLSDR